jgi:RimJ/RimL family protein N-acetyltransferase
MTMMNVPDVLETGRLTLRLFDESDWLPLCELFSDEESVRHTIKTPLEDWQTWRMLACYIGHWRIRGYGPYAVISKEDGGLVGVVGLWCPGEWPEPELKWALQRRFWGRGYATEAAAAVRDMVKTELRWQRLISLIFQGNHRSIAVAQRLGAKHERTIPFRDGTADIFVHAM